MTRNIVNDLWPAWVTEMQQLMLGLKHVSRYTFPDLKQSHNHLERCWMERVTQGTRRIHLNFLSNNGVSRVSELALSRKEKAVLQAGLFHD